LRVAVTVDGLMVELRDRRPGRLGKKVWGPVRTDPPIPAVTWDGANKPHRVVTNNAA
jgi:hypothetical protein